MPENSYNHWTLFEAVAQAAPERECVVFRDRRLSYSVVRERAERFAGILLGHGITIRRPRNELEPWESGQDHVGLYLHNGNEYLEAQLGADAARAAPFNVNYRYVDRELQYLLDDADVAALVYHAAFAPLVRVVLPRLRRQPLLLQVADRSGHDLLPGALDYESALAEASTVTPHEGPSPDDLYILYTGGTTGMPKGALWRQADLYQAALSGFAVSAGIDNSSLENVGAAVSGSSGPRTLAVPPFMHGAAQWAALGTMLCGGTVVIQSEVTRLDPADVWRTVDQEKVQGLLLVGDAFARPLAEELALGGYDARSVALVASGGAVTSPAAKARLLELLPQAIVADVGGASETGSQLSQVSTAGEPASSGTFAAQPTTCVVSEERTSVLEPGHEGIGWLARRGDAIPLGYLGDPAKTSSTFPVVAGERMVVPGDRARLRADGLVELLGRESMTINSGGEKIFAEEVEQAVLAHPEVEDVLVVGRASERWGQEVVAVVQLRDGGGCTDEELLDAGSSRLARFKLPKAIIRVPVVVRSPAGKADYAWARALATEGT